MNAKTEILELNIKIKSAIICLNYSEDFMYNNGKQKIIILYPNYSVKDYDEFLLKLDFDYSQYLRQFVAGFLWINDKWIERMEYDCSEWWELKETPRFETIKNKKYFKKL